MKKNIVFITMALLLVLLFTGCSVKADEAEVEIKEEKIRIVATTFPQYDFVKNIVGEAAEVELLLKPGLETHSFEPSPQDIINISKSDMFIYTGGEAWVEELVNAMDTSHIELVSLMSVVDVLEEEIVEGMEHGHAHEEHAHEEDEHEEHVHEEDEHEEHEHEEDEHEEHEHEEDEHEEHAHEEDEHLYDEHVWMSPQNAIAIVKHLEGKLSIIDKTNHELYESNTNAYIEELKIVDELFKDVVDSATRHEIMVADRFPFRYLTEAYGLSYYAAFSGCSTQTDASPDTIAFMIDTVNDQGMPVVFYTEQSNQLLADIVVESTSAKKYLLHSCHNISKEDIEKGVSYISLMRQNAENLREALK